MSAVTKTAPLPIVRTPPLTFRRLLVVYLVLVLLPYFWSLTQGLAWRGVYPGMVTLLNLGGFAAFLAQYPLSGRVESVTRRAGIDHGMWLHRRIGELLALYFLLHPFLIVLPRYVLAPERATADIWTALAAAESTTGLYAWAIMIAWVLMARFRNRLGLGYEAWRISHGLGLVVVAILATHHVVTVGRHGRYDPWFDALWIVLCFLAVAVVAYTYFVRPLRLQRRPFKVVDVSRASMSDWYLTIEKDGDFDFDFDAGQFVWINTTGNPFIRAEHPFSIASSPTDTRRISFVIRELGDYTRRLSSLQPGQRVFVDGPHGVFTLVGRKAGGIALIAGGAGIGPILGILRQLCDLGESRAVRLVYGNRTIGQMVFQSEIAQTSAEMADFRQILALEQPAEGVDAHTGFIDRDMLARTFPSDALASWLFYVCGPPVMVEAVAAHLRALGVESDRVLFEQLAF